MRREYWGVLIVLVILDAITTVFIIWSGGVEYNPLWKPIAGNLACMILAKAGIIVALALILPGLDNHFRRKYDLRGFPYCVLFVLLAPSVQNIVQMAISFR
ncbi:MAG: DUF5658 family protein [Methanoregulaceae archaeon]